MVMVLSTVLDIHPHIHAQHPYQHCSRSSKTLCIRMNLSIQACYGETGFQVCEKQPSLTLNTA